MFGIDWSLLLYLYSNASKYCGGLVITQFQIYNNVRVKIPIVYNSFTFTATERKYPTYKRELLAIVRFTTKYNYLLTYPNPLMTAIIHTDHKLLIHFIDADYHDGIYRNWAIKLRELNVKIQYIPDTRNKIADGLSRTIFDDIDCTINERSKTLKNELDRQGP
jgi:hypothetical protein